MIHKTIIETDVDTNIQSQSNFPIVYIDDVPIQIIPPDYDKDGKIGGIERLQAYNTSGITNLAQKSELAESLENLDSDKVDPQSKMTDIDLNSNLVQGEKTGYGVIDFLVSAEALPVEVQYLTRRMKRLAVSVGGQGREQKVRMVAGDRAHKEGGGTTVFDKFKGLFGGTSPNQGGK